MAEKMIKLRFSALITTGIVIAALAVLVFVVTTPSEAPQQPPAEEETQEVVVGEDCDLAALESGDVPEGWFWRVQPALCIGYAYPLYVHLITHNTEKNGGADELRGAGWDSAVDVTQPEEDGTLRAAWKNKVYTLEDMRRDFQRVKADAVEFMIDEPERIECEPGAYCYSLYAVGEIGPNKLLRFQFQISVDEYSPQEALDLVEEMLKTVRVR